MGFETSSEAALGEIPEAAASPAFERKLDIYDKLYDDEIQLMLDELPELVNKCKQLSDTDLGRNYADLRIPTFVLGSNKLEGTSSLGASEERTFKVLLEFLNSREEFGDGIPWEEEGKNDSDEAWYEQCKAHTNALNMMIAWAAAGEPLTADTLFECHNVLMRGAISSASKEAFHSRYRAFDEPVTSEMYIFPNRTDHKQDMADQLEKRNAEFDTSHPLAWASDLMLDVLTLHPFLNGNGRLARLCFTYGLMRHGIPCSIVFSDWHSKDRAHFIHAVKAAQGQKGPIKREKLYSMAVVGLYSTLNNMLTFCKSAK
jgi:Fic family protein